MSQLVCENLSLGYDSKEIVSNINFTVNSGEYLFVIGENGSGKTTLIKTLLGLHTPMIGKVIIGDDLKRNEIGYLPQKTDIQKDFPASVEEVVFSGCHGKMGIRPFYNKKEKKTAERAIEKMGLAELRKKCYCNLSGGQQQRVLLARALCATEKLLLLDEPVSGLDPKVTLEMYDLISSLNSQDGITIIMISHDIHAALKYASHILYVGSRTFFGTREEYLASDVSANFVLTEGDDE